MSSIAFPERIHPAAALLLMTLVLGCGGGERETGTESATTPAAAETAAPAPAAPEAGQPSATRGPQVDSALPDYQKASGVSGTLTSVGSDTLNNLMTLWAEDFKRLYPSVRIQVEGKGSSTAPPALIEGTAQLGPMSREMKSSEIDEFEKKHGYKPTQIRVAVDALAVYVNRDNPLERLTLPQVDAIFSKGRACGHPRPIDTWGATGLNDPAWASQRLSLYGRNSASGTYGFFKEHALCKGDFRDTVKEQPGSASVVQGVTEDRNGIGYSGIGYKTSGLKALQIARAEGAPFHGTEPETVLSGEYPLSRLLYIYLNKPPGRPLDPLVRELLAYILGKGGQQVVVKDGYLPLPAEMAARERQKLQ